jgi:oxidase EvaA
MIVQVEDKELDRLPDGFIWVTLRQISRLLRRDNLIHACARSILSALIIPERVAGRTRRPAEPSVCGTGDGSIGAIVQWLDDQKSANHFLVKRRGLNALKEWSMDRDGSFSHEDGRFFRVIGISVESSTREVTTWNQPILDNPGTGIIGILTKVEKGVRYFLMQAKAEPGNRGIVQLGPTVQFTPGNYIGNKKLPKPFLFDEFCFPEQMQLLYESMQSEEGARFYKESHIHRILSLREGAVFQHPTEFRWISRGALPFLISMGETVNSCARSVLSLMLYEEPQR